MAHFVRIIKAISLKNKWKHYLAEKEIGLNQSESDFQFSRKFQGWWLSRLIYKFGTSGSNENVVWKSFIGFAGGILLTHIFFFFFYVGVSFSLKTATYMCGLAGIFLSLGLAFSSKVRCYVLLLLPVFFSKQGRQALLAYALFLAFTGPARNTMHNMKILSESMSCGQEMVRRTLKQIIDMVKAPFRSIKETMQKIKKAVKEVVEPVKALIMKIKRIIVSILKVIKNATTWLGSIVNFCNKKVGTPFQRCMKTFDDAIADCKAKLGVMDFLCHVVHIVKALCYTVKWLDFICMFTEFVSDNVIGVVKRKLREFNFHMKNLFYVSIEFSHSYEFETTASIPTNKVAKTILQKISKQVEKLQSILSFFGFMFSFLFVLAFAKVYYYKYKYLSSDQYDNVYINKYIVELDIKRGQMDRETVLPLEPKEKKKYGKPTSVRLLKNEKIRIAQSVFLLSLTSFKIITFVVVDYSLFWILMTIYEARHGAVEEVEKSRAGIHVAGKGILVDFYRNLGNAFQVPENPHMQLTPLHCLPDPVHPDTGRYIQIGFLVTLCWILTVTEAYGLRLRNVVMSHYYPDRARERAVWLYNDILRSRASFLRFARRQLRRKFRLEDEKTVEKITLTQRLFADFPILGALFGKSKECKCLLCGGFETKTEPLKRCKTPDCQGRYCLECFASLENVCTICQHPIEYGDISDISEEVDSSEEDLYQKRNLSLRREYDSDVSDDNKKFKTFKDMETRDKFRDVEANKLSDYARLMTKILIKFSSESSQCQISPRSFSGPNKKLSEKTDLYHDKAALQRRLKEVLQKHIQTIEQEKSRKSQDKLSEYKQIKSKLRNVISDLNKKKMEQLRVKKSTLKKKFVEKINYLRRLNENKTDEVEKLLGKDVFKPPKSKVSFKVDETEETRANYNALKNEIKEKIKAFVENKKSKLPASTPIIIKSETLTHKKELASNDDLEKIIKFQNNYSSKDSDKNSEIFLTYYVVNEKTDSRANVV